MEVQDFSNKMQIRLFPWVQILIFPLYDQCSHSMRERACLLVSLAYNIKLMKAYSLKCASENFVQLLRGNFRNGEDFDLDPVSSERPYALCVNNDY